MLVPWCWDYKRSQPVLSELLVSHPCRSVLSVLSTGDTAVNKSEMTLSPHEVYMPVWKGEMPGEEAVL